MTKIQPNNEVPEPMKRGASTPSTADKKSAGGRMPQSGPGRTQSDDMKHKQRSGGDAGRGEADDEDAGNRRGGQHTQQETDEEGGRSRQGDRSRNM